jgi:hypothetical protein
MHSKMLCTASVCVETKSPKYLLKQICEDTYEFCEVTHWTSHHTYVPEIEKTKTDSLISQTSKVTFNMHGDFQYIRF